MPPALTHSLFKYFGHQTSPLENGGLRVLEHLALKVTPPIEFNDPFEFTPLLKTKPSNERAKKGLKEILKDRTFFDQNRAMFPNCRNFSDFQRAIRANLAGVTTSIVSRTEVADFQFQRDVLPLISKTFGLICFSADSTHPLMWAHYASSHGGIVLEFDQNCPLFNGLGFLQVEYLQERAVYDPDHPKRRELVEALARRKSPVWSYEREYRLLINLRLTTKALNKTGQSRFFIKIDPNWIKSVTVGTRASVEINAEINKLLRRPDLEHLHASRYRMEMDTETFNFSRHRIDHF